MNIFRVRLAPSRIVALTLLNLLFLGLCACDSGPLIDLALNPPGRKPIDNLQIGVNNFFVDREFGSISEQYSDIRDNIRIPYVRVLLAWTNGVQPSPSSEPDFGFFDSILDSVPAGVDVLVVVAHTPDWITDPSNWVDGNPRLTWVKRWLEPVVLRYRGNGRIVGFEVCNEPDVTTVPSDVALGIENPDDYAELLTFASNSIRALAPGKLVVMAATTSIQQNFPTTLQYNQRLQQLGIENLIDVWNIHYYGKSFESVVTQNGVADFLNGLILPIWVTESGEQGPDQQLEYVETVWPFLVDKVSGIQRFYYYQYSSPAPAPDNFGLRTSDPAFPVSDLYIFLRDQRGRSQGA